MQDQTKHKTYKYDLTILQFGCC